MPETAQSPCALPGPCQRRGYDGSRLSPRPACPIQSDIPVLMTWHNLVPVCTNISVICLYHRKQREPRPLGRCLVCRRTTSEHTAWGHQWSLRSALQGAFVTVCCIYAGAEAGILAGTQG